ncbi:universal stress protein [Nocardiopsis lambiniae]|uniref:Universal stress protein n=1 Tax=Nocardiopsis lambiniae TaxID=3075539 RepID=A0ABU2M703_9ACTN|nr:universal stress protein [Nocardiopsis sp. DSM 44743]MDT0328426.1 universal stress protein [Nocardiopsis sp. DSM 44743]
MISDDPRSPKIVLGVDGSEPARLALEWAAAEVRRTRRPLDIVFALPMPLLVMSEGPTRPSATEQLRSHGEEVLAEAAARVRVLAPDARVRTFLEMDDPASALLERSDHEDLLVVGSRGLGALRVAVTGSTAVRLAARAHCPVVVVPAEWSRTDRTGRIVVGVDDSEVSRPALRFAFGRAREDGVSLVVVHSWEMTTPFAPEAMIASGWTPPEEMLAERSAEMISTMFAELGEETEGVDVSVLRTRVSPVEALAAEGEKSDMVVVGSRGRGGIRGLFLGSVSQGVLHRSTVPVVVIPHHAEDPEDTPWAGGGD